MCANELYRERSEHGVVGEVRIAVLGVCGFDPLRCVPVARLDRHAFRSRQGGNPLFPYSLVEEELAVIGVGVGALVVALPELGSEAGTDYYRRSEDVVVAEGPGQDHEPDAADHEPCRRQAPNERRAHRPHERSNQCG